MKSFFLIFFTLILCDAALPATLMACHGPNSSKEVTCSPESDKATDAKKKCCQKKKAKNADHQCSKEGCGGNCNNKSCQCRTGQMAAILPILDQVQCHAIVLLRKENFSYKELPHSADIQSLWLPPKIS